LEINSVSNVKVVPKAVSSECGKSKFYILEQEGHHSLGYVKTSNLNKVEEVDTVTLDVFCEENHIEYIDLLKVDVEGFELEVFQGCSKMLSKKKVGLICFEISSGPLNDLSKKSSDILSYLALNNYCITDLNYNEIDINTQFSGHTDLLSFPQNKHN
jgi:FkbM family methyltransferase